VRLQETPGGGVTANVQVPVRLLQPRWSSTNVAPADNALTNAIGRPPVATLQSFAWFGTPGAQPPPHLALTAVAGPEVLAFGDDRDGLHRRVPGAHLFDAGSSPIPAGRVRQRDAADEAAQLMDYARGAERAEAERARPAVDSPMAPVQTTKNGLVRRVPGAQLDPAVLRHESRTPIARHDPQAEQASLDAFFAGLARAEEIPTSNREQ
jgi:hypothetical protein